jgi:SAM-dependent methyltransferase
MIGPYLGREVLEVGAGIGANTSLFCGPGQTRWVCLEPDARLAGEIKAQITAGTLPGVCEAVTGTLGNLDPDRRFDSVIYVDVLEHIQDDRAEVLAALRFLRPGGHLVALSPAHQFLFSPFDESIGHFRRYSRRSLRAIVPAEVIRLSYLDSAGLILSSANRFLLRQKMPTLKQIQFWNKRVIPVSRVLDPLVGYRVGKSVLGVWRKGNADG